MLESLELLRDRSFAVLIVVSGLVGIMLAFYFGLESSSSATSARPTSASRST